MVSRLGGASSLTKKAVTVIPLDAIYYGVAAKNERLTRKSRTIQMLRPGGPVIFGV